MRATANQNDFYKTFPRGNKSQWIMGLSVAITCSNSTSWAMYLRIHTYFFSSANLTAKVQMRNKIPYSEFPFRTSSLLLHRAKQLSCMMKVSLANVSGGHLKREFTILAFITIFSWNISLIQVDEWSTELCTLGQRSSKKKEVILQVAPRLENNWEEFALLIVPKLVLELHYAA